MITVILILVDVDYLFIYSLSVYNGFFIGDLVFFLVLELSAP